MLTFLVLSLLSTPVDKLSWEDAVRLVKAHGRPAAAEYTSVHLSIYWYPQEDSDYQGWMSSAQVEMRVQVQTANDYISHFPLSAPIGTEPPYGSRARYTNSIDIGGSQAWAYRVDIEPQMIEGPNGEKAYVSASSGPVVQPIGSGSLSAAPHLGAINIVPQ